MTLSQRSTMVDRNRCWSLIFILFILPVHLNCYEKTLRKIVRNQSKMVQQPFSVSIGSQNTTIGQDGLFPPGLAQVKTFMRSIHRPKMSTILSSLDTGKSKSTYSKMIVTKSDNINPLEFRLTKNTFNNLTMALKGATEENYQFSPPTNVNSTEGGNGPPNYKVTSVSKFFPSLDERDLQSVEEKSITKDNLVIIPTNREVESENSNVILKGKYSTNAGDKSFPGASAMNGNTVKSVESDDKVDFLIEELPKDFTSRFSSNINNTIESYSCKPILEVQVDIDAQVKFSELDIEPTWMWKKQFWDNIFDSRYQSLMRSSSWPSFYAIIMPSSHVDSIWKRTFEQYHYNTVSKILSNVVKKLQFYTNFTFTWNEVSHLSLWWKRTNHKNRSAFRNLLKSGRLEITTGWWVETEEAPAHLFGIVHQLIEGHQWLKSNLNYIPKVGWSTNSVTHSPTIAYLLSAMGITNYVITNVHYSWEQYLAEFQYSDFIWLQDWDKDINIQTNINYHLDRIGNNRYPKHAVFTHFLQFNSDDTKACGPNKDICAKYFDFVNTKKRIDVQSYNVKEKSEILLELYSKTGTITPHNVIIAPVGGRSRFESQTEFDYQYNNYRKIMDFINVNSNIYRANLEFGTPKDYFNAIFERRKSFYPTLKGDFLNFADIRNGIPAYWTGFFTSRPLLKILLRRIHATLRTTEILLSFAINFDVIPQNITLQLIKLLVNSRENVARLQDRHVVGGTLSSSVLQYVYRMILLTAKSCWYIQEIAASSLTAKRGTSNPFLKKYVFREGEFISPSQTINPEDQIYFFNSLSHERTEVIELKTRQPNIRIIDYNKKELTVQINPMWTYNANDNSIEISKSFFKAIFVIIIPPFTLELFKIKGSYDTTSHVATVYCMHSIVDRAQYDNASAFPFKIQPLQPGDIQLENYKHRLVIDEFTGFLKTVIEKETNIEKAVSVDYGAFKSSDVNAGMFLFNTNITNPLHDILRSYRMGITNKIAIIIAGIVTTEMTTIFGRLIQHTLKIFNLMSSPLANSIYIESKVDYDISPRNREIELFLSLKTDISNGNNPEVIIDNNGFQYTSRILNISKRIESNMYPVTNMVFIQDFKNRMTLITDHAQAVTAFHEGHLAIMLDRRVLFNDERGTNEGLADSSTTYHRHYLLLENFYMSSIPPSTGTPKSELKLPSFAATYLANTLDNVIDIFVVDKEKANFLYFAFIPLIKTPIPCAIAVVNFRVIVGSKFFHSYVPNTALLVLHRHGMTCHIENTSLFCNDEIKIILGKVFHNIKAAFITNLVGTDEGIPVSIITQNNISAMELVTVKILF